MTWAVVALKSPDRAKSRLAEELDPSQRRRLLFVLTEQTIQALRGTRGIDAIAVVTSSREVASFIRSRDAQVITQDRESGTADAFACAVRQLRPLKPKRLLMLPGDLPLVSPPALLRVLEAAESGPGIVLVPDRHWVGTNALLCTPPEILAPQFGDSSFSRHLEAARAAGVSARIVAPEELTLDLDLPEDLRYLRTHWKARAPHVLQAAGWLEECPDCCSIAEGAAPPPRLVAGRP